MDELGRSFSPIARSWYFMRMPSLARRLAAAALVLAGTWVAGSPASAQTRTIGIAAMRPQSARVLTAQGVRSIATEVPATVTATSLVALELARPITLKPTETGGVRLQLPYQLYGVDPSGKPLDLELVVDVDHGGLTVAPDGNHFAGELRLGVVDRAEPTATRSLPQQVMVQVTGDLDTISPATVVLAHTNLPFEIVALSAAAPDGPSVALRFRPSFAASETPTTIAVRRPTVHLQVSPAAIDGFGLQEATVTARLDGLPSAEGRSISLTTDRGHLAATSLTLDSLGAATTTIRSIGAGRANMVAHSAFADSQPQAIDFRLPWLFLIASVLGGALGAGIRAGSGRQGPSRRLARTAVVGALIGILVAAAWAVGVNLTGVRPAVNVGEAAVFVTAGIGGYLGRLVGIGA